MKTKLHNHLCKIDIDDYQSFLFNNIFYWMNRKCTLITIWDERYNEAFLELDLPTNKLINKFEQNGLYWIEKKLGSSNSNYLSWQWGEIDYENMLT